jgi:hypothetical protein
VIDCICRDWSVPRQGKASQRLISTTGQRGFPHKYVKMKTSKSIQDLAHQAASETGPNTPAVKYGRDTSGPTIPRQKDREKTENRICKRIKKQVGAGLHFSILANAANAMLDDLEHDSGVPITESDLFAANGRLTEQGERYLWEALETPIIDDLVAIYDTLIELSTVLDKECLNHFKIERAAAKLAKK